MTESAGRLPSDGTDSDGTLALVVSGFNSDASLHRLLKLLLYIFTMGARLCEVTSLSGLKWVQGHTMHVCKSLFETM